MCVRRNMTTDIDHCPRFKRSAVDRYALHSFQAHSGESHDKVCFADSCRPRKPIPHLVCVCCSEAIEFYKKAFGAEEVSRMPAPDGRRLLHASLASATVSCSWSTIFRNTTAEKRRLLRPSKGNAGGDSSLRGRLRRGRQTVNGKTPEPYYYYAATRHVLGRSLCPGDGSVRSQMVIRDAHRSSHSRADAGGHERGLHRVHQALKRCATA